MVDDDKRRVMYEWFKNTLHADIFFIQETHATTPSQTQQWAAEWAGVNRAQRTNPLERAAWFSLSSSPHTGGTAILCSPRFLKQNTITHVTTRHTHNGFLTTITATHNHTQRSVTYASVYLPSKPHPRLRAIRSLPPIPPQEEWMIGGDWNCVEHQERDSNRPDKYFPKGGKETKHFIDTHDLVDAWSITHPTDTQFTRTHHNGTSTRIDRIYTTPELTPHVNATALLHTPQLSDHKALQLNLILSHSSHKSPYWRLNTSILQLPATDFIVRNTIRIALKQRRGAPILEWWLSLKAALKKALISHSKQITKARNQLTHTLTTKLDNPSTPLSDIPTLQAHLHELLALKSKKTQLMAGAKREEIGDRPTASFFARAAARSSSRTITSLSVPHTPTPIFDNKLITNTLTDFWREVFGPPHTHPTPRQRQAAQDSLARLKRKLSYMHKRQLSAPYTEEEVRFAAFKGNGRAAPGIDGLPREFYTHYWEDLGPILHELVIAVQQGLTLPQVLTKVWSPYSPKQKQYTLSLGNSAPSHYSM